MASVTFNKTLDLNRMRRTYPYIRKQPHEIYVSSRQTVIETGTITFTNESVASYTFLETYTSAPITTITLLDSSNSDTINVNIFIKSVSTTTLIVESSALFTGTVNFQ